MYFCEINFINMVSEKQCTKCKDVKPIDDFYKNKLTSDGHSIYCIPCTKINSQNYFQRKKLKLNKIENDKLMKFALMSNYEGQLNEDDVQQLMKLVLIEKMITQALDEINHLKKTFLQGKEIMVEV